MLLQLQKYDLKFIYKKGTELYVADTLSPSYIDEKSDPDVDEQVDILSLTSISPARMAELQKHALADPVMQKVTHFISNGWPAKSKSVPRKAQPYFLIKDNILSITLHCYNSIISHFTIMQYFECTLISTKLLLTYKICLPKS